MILSEDTTRKPMMIKSSSLSARLSLVTAILAVSTSAILIRWSTAPALTIAFWRLAFSTLMMALLWLLFEKKEINIIRHRDVSWLVILVLSGFSLSLHFVFWISSLDYTTVAASVAIVDSSPLLVLLLSRLFLNETLKRMQLIGMFIATFGGLLIAIADWQTVGNNLHGDLLAFLGTIMVAFYFIFGRYLRKDTGLFTYTTVVYGTAALMTGLIAVVSGVPLLGYSRQEFILFFLMALGPSALGHTLFNHALKYFRAPIVSTATLGEAVGSSILAFLIFSEMPSPLVIIGGMILLSGVFLTTYEREGKSTITRNPKKL